MTSTPTSAWAHRALVAVALLIHLAVVLSVAQQPLRVNRADPSTRSVIWPLHNDTVHRFGPASDFFAVYHAGANLRQGHTPYSHLERPRRTPYFFGFRYLPVVGQTLGRAATHLEPRHAWWGWIIVLEVTLALFIVVFRRRAREAWLQTLGTCLPLLSSPYMLELHMGQFTFLTVSLVLIGLMVHGWPDDDTDANPVWTGAASAAAFTVAVLLKLFPLATAPAQLRDRRHWPALGAAVALTLITGLAFFIPNPEAWDRFYQANFSRPGGGMNSGNYGLVYLLYLLGNELQWSVITDHWWTFVAAFRNVILAGTALWVLFARAEVLLGVCLMFLAHFVSYIHVWEHHMSALIPIGLVMLAVQRQTRRPPPWVLGVVIAATVALALPTLFVFIDEIKDTRVEFPNEAWSFSAQAALVLCKALPTAALYGVCAWWVGQQGFGWPPSLAWSRQEEPPEPVSADGPP